MHPGPLRRPPACQAHWSPNGTNQRSQLFLEDKKECWPLSKKQKLFLISPVTVENWAFPQHPSWSWCLRTSTTLRHSAFSCIHEDITLLSQRWNSQLLWNFHSRKAAQSCLTRNQPEGVSLARCQASGGLGIIVWRVGSGVQWAGGDSISLSSFPCPRMPSTPYHLE